MVGSAIGSDIPYITDYGVSRIRPAGVGVPRSEKATTGRQIFYAKSAQDKMGERAPGTPSGADLPRTHGSKCLNAGDLGRRGRAQRSGRRRNALGWDGMDAGCGWANKQFWLDFLPRWVFRIIQRARTR